VIYAIDCDLRKIYCRSEAGVTITSSNNSLREVIDALRSSDLVLYEIASAVDYTDSKAVAHQKRRWTIWNVATAATLYAVIRTIPNARMLVAPSSAWTNGHPLDVRTKVVKSPAKNKDLRECDAMMFYYRNNPLKWVPYQTFMDTI